MKNILKNYKKKFPKENIKKIETFLLGEADFFDRKNFKGHIVANALIINKGRVLTIFHNKLKMYIQPGGHVDNGESVLDATIREVEEETGLKNIILHKWHKKTEIPIFIESHLIPENKKKNEAQHLHHDFMYIFNTDQKKINLQLNEVSGFDWVKIEDVFKKNPDSFIGKSLQKMVVEKIL